MTTHVPVIVIGGLTLTGKCYWVNQYQWQSVGQSKVYGLQGDHFVIEGARAGRPIVIATIDGCALPDADLQTLTALASTPGATHTLSIDGAPYTVRFDRETGPIVAERQHAIVPRFSVTIYLIEA